MQPHPEIIKSEGIIARTIETLEQEITWWRRQFGMGRDLLLNPMFVMESLTTGDFVHLSGVKRQMGKISGTDFIYYRYRLSHLNGPRITDLGIRGWPAMDEGERFKLLTRPPEVIFRYAHPFADP